MKQAVDAYFVPSGLKQRVEERAEAIGLGLKVSLPEVEYAEKQESACAADCN